MAYKNRACLFIAACENEAKRKEKQQEGKGACLVIGEKKGVFLFDSGFK